MRVHEARIIKKNPDLVSRSVGAETIIMPLVAASDDLNCIWSLNDCASRVWELIDGKRSIRRIRQILLAEFDAGEEELDRELAELFDRLQEIKAIK